jgi:hypothetical protein
MTISYVMVAWVNKPQSYGGPQSRDRTT